ncbi:Metal tolerance protein C1 [Neolecta irregularis DAH-3]|uniref:Metal tolerance protein C1 n=1 Tax=Neolecta irregularis (strain DAH-3) TaxID=1198029 RepID=A0A1U7LIH8_NEOID|nr:Metal tolerance protein C1 [Neolecta irregularis DAH-3]|eukprot:OLL22466.1 Metal tolerance protein C1 [Neolecta irregularis DAH-3]
MGHSHSHEHSHRHSHKAHTTSAEGLRVTTIGLVLNILLTLIKGIGGYILSSASLIADAGHSLSDLLGDSITIFTLSFSSRSPSNNFPNGFGRIETIGSLGVSLMLTLGGVTISWSALFPHSNRHGHHDHHDPDFSSPFAASLALLGVLSKVYLYVITTKVAKASKSPVLLANAYHHLSDAMSSVVASLAIVLGWVLGVEWGDSVGGAIVGVMIIKSGLEIGWPALLELCGKGVDEETLNEIKDAIKVKNASIRKISAERSGSSMIVNVDLRVDGETAISQVGEIRETIRKQISDQVENLLICRIETYEDVKKDI